MLNKFSERIYYMRGEDLTDRPYLYYIRGDNKNFAVDAGNSANHVSRFYNELRKYGLAEPDYTVITHWHWDHTFGMNAVSGKTIASKETDRKLREAMSFDWSEAAIDRRIKSGREIEYCAECIKNEYTYLSDIVIIPADIFIEKPLEIDLGGITCRIIPHDSPHSRDSIFIYIPEEKALIVGDADYEDYYENDYLYDKTRVKALLEFIESIDFDYYFRGHEDMLVRYEAIEFLNAQMENNEKASISVR